MQILDFDQRSPEWYTARRGIPTASEFGSIITAKRMDYASAADTYINALIDEIIRPDAERGFSGTRHMRRGCALEDNARELYAFMHDIEPRQVGFILSDDGTMGCSPDSLIDPDGGLEIKCPDGPTHVKWLRGKSVPDEYKAQTHGSMIITGRAWWDFLSYCPGYPPLLVRVTPDAFTDKLRKHLVRFNTELEAAKAAFNLAEAA